VNFPHDKSNRSADYQFTRSKVKVTGGKKNLKRMTHRAGGGLRAGRLRRVGRPKRQLQTRPNLCLA